MEKIVYENHRTSYNDRSGFDPYSGRELHLDTDIFESRLLTSLGLLDLVARLEQEFKIIILPEELIHEHFVSIATIIGFIDNKLAEAS